MRLCCLQFLSEIEDKY